VARIGVHIEVGEIATGHIKPDTVATRKQVACRENGHFNWIYFHRRHEFSFFTRVAKPQPQNAMT
jgi:hypothetical protein